MKANIHQFNESLEASHRYSDLPFWKECYEKAFAPHFATMVDHRENGYWQKLGIDRTIVLNTSKTIAVDEKVRYKDFGDIALEYLSNDRTDAPGWVCKPLLADYIAYAVLPASMCYLLPVIQLQQVWLKHGTEWRKAADAKSGGFSNVAAHNSGYTTHSVAVPLRILFPAIGNALRISFTPVKDLN